LKNMFKNVTTDTIQKVPKSQYLFAVKGIHSLMELSPS
jgi:hypothetical protein